MVYINGNPTPKDNWVKFSLDSSMPYYETKDAIDNKKTTYAGYGLNATVEKNMPKFIGNTALNWRVNGNFGYAGARDSAYLYEIEDTFSYSNINLDLSLKRQVNRELHWGILGGYSRETAEHYAYYEELVDSDHNGSFETILTGNQTDSIKSNRFRLGLDFDYNFWNIKTYYSHLNGNTKFSGPGFELSYNAMPFTPYAKFVYDNKFSKLTRADVGFTIAFLTLGWRMQRYGNEEIPKVSEAYIGASVCWK